MKRIERECMKCGGRRYLGDFDVCTVSIIFVPQIQEKCTLCGYEKRFRIIITELKEVSYDKE